MMIDISRRTLLCTWLSLVVWLSSSSRLWETEAWVSPSNAVGTMRAARLATTLFADVSAATTVSDNQSSSDEDDADEYEYVEYDALTEAEFVGSEWLVGTNWDRRSDAIEETWVRLVVNEDGKNLCYWGDNSEGKWSLDVASQFLSISKESFFGKQIWAGVVDDYYFLQGTVRGWTYLQPA